MTMQKFSIGASVWVPDNEEVFISASVVAQRGEEVDVKIDARHGASRQATVHSSECYAVDKDTEEDMTKLVYLHEAGVLNNLHVRYSQSEIYTYTGNILIAVNPFQRIPELYDSHMRQKYQKSNLGELPPHIFAIADSVYRAMETYKQRQSILISGESGAGKTETTKLVMEYLAGVGGRAKSSGRSVESQVLESNPLLEAFGNAKTVRNNNSSRFGKYIQIQFNKWGRVSGASIKTYLLERSRVVNINSPERNFHCFYQLCDGASEDDIVKYRLPSTLKRAQTFRYLNQSVCFELDGVTNAEEYHCTQHAMDVLGISKTEQESIWKIVSAILHLGNVEFVEGEDHNEPLKPKDSLSQKHLDDVAYLLQCDRERLEVSLVHKFLKISNKYVPGRVDVKGALTIRDSLAKNLYAKLFDWIVDHINRAIGEDAESDMSIGVLDIYGFEHFKHNSFEQFCINLANEKLQQHFNMHVLKMEQEEYEREQINWSRIAFSDNQDRLDLIEKDKRSILSILDADSKLGAKSAEGFTRTLYKEFSQHSRFSMSKTSRTDFTLDHYAGKVKYSTEEFMSKNVDAVVPEHHKLLSVSTDAVVAEMFSERSADLSNQFTSIGLSFKKQLGELMDTLNETQPHYVRCVKPNSKLKPLLFERHLVMSQLRSGGVLEAVRMCSAGYPTRRLFEDFLDRFWVLSRQPRKKECSGKKLCEVLMEATGLSDYQVGLTKIFLRAGQMVALDTLLSTQQKAAIRIQRRIRRCWFIRERTRNSIYVQAMFRGLLGRREFAATQESRTKAALVLQKQWRMKAVHMEFLLLKRTVIYLQKLVRRRIENDLVLMAKVREGMDRKTCSKAELITRAKLDKAMDEFHRLEEVVQERSQSLADAQAELSSAQEKVISYAQALERITGEREPILDTFVEAEEEAQSGSSGSQEDFNGLVSQLEELQSRLTAKEQEVRTLKKRLASVPALLRKQHIPPDQQQAILLSEIATCNFGFSDDGTPVAAVVIFKSLVHWKVFESERTNTFDHVIEAMQSGARSLQSTTICYWLCNTVYLYYFVREHGSLVKSQQPSRPGFPFFNHGGEQQESKENVDAMFFQVHLGASIQRLYITIRNSAKVQLGTYLGGSRAGNVAPTANGRAKTTESEPSQLSGTLRVRVSGIWSSIMSCLQEVWQDVVQNHVPALLVHSLIRQLLEFINLKIFNNLMVKSPWCPCTYSNGLVMGEGLAGLLAWLQSEVDPWLEASFGGMDIPSVGRFLSHVQQAVFFLLMDEKPEQSLEEIQITCPTLNMNQLVHLSIWYQDDRQNVSGVDPAVIELMWAHMDEEEPMLLKDDEGLPFDEEDVVSCMYGINPDDVIPPNELLERGLHFLADSIREM